eukprot:TRINITY_DN597_c0_g1_i1.p1 TRINITY_DN597_c0_g1~~TRINITY_DN597_c0_g1_i1.p1  ORF type:complete len:137 (-),score=49.75 TRINITY_DN597_c0_g1_i1:275-643(-)
MELSKEFINKLGPNESYADVDLFSIPIAYKLALATPFTIHCRNQSDEYLSTRANLNNSLYDSIPAISNLQKCFGRVIYVASNHCSNSFYSLSDSIQKNALHGGNRTDFSEFNTCMKKNIQIL